MSAIPIATLTALQCIQKQYDARSPSVPGNIALPAPLELAQWEIQSWLVEHLLQPEAHLASRAPASDRAGEPAEDVLGAQTWRRAFWKRVIARIERGVSEAPEEDELEVHESILFALADLMREPASSATYLRRFRYTAKDGRDQCITILEYDGMISQGTTGLRTWEASLRLANHFIAFPELVIGKRALELGSGAGLLSVLVGQIQHDSHAEGGASSITSTDFDDGVLERLKSNLALNDAQITAVHKVDWNNANDLQDLPVYDLVIAADVNYDPDLAAPLVHCLSHVLKPDVPAYIAATVRIESTTQLFLDLCREKRLQVHEVPFGDPPVGHELVGREEEHASVKLFRVSTGG